MSAAAEELAHPKFENALGAEIQRVFAKQQAHAVRLRTSTAAERIARLHKLRDALLNRKEAIYRACYADFKKPQAEVDLTELTPVFAEIKHTAKHLKRWMKPQYVWPTALMFGTSTRVRSEPKGVSLIISPWNYPLNLTFMPLVSAIAAGCTAILKPSEMTPHLSALMAEIVSDTFSEEDVALFEGEVDVSTALLDLPFDHIFFTGSPGVGKVVMAAAAKHLTSVTLELGGKSPTVIDETADLERAAKGVLFGKYTNAGQTCIAPDYIFVHVGIKEKFIEACRKRLTECYGADVEQSGDLARVVNSRHFGRINKLLEDAIAKGAKVAAGGQTNTADNYIAPTLLTDIPAEADIMDEEIFGPLLPILGFSDLDTVIRSINAKPKPLALYMYGKDPQRIERVLKNTSAGGTCVNTCVTQYLHMNAPFGGVNNSGIGSSHGIWGFRAFSHERTTVVNKFSASILFAPPYTDFVRRLIALVMKSAT